MANNFRQKVDSGRHTSRNFNLLDWFTKKINENIEIEDKISPDVIKKIIWVMFLILIYIFFQHNFEGLIRKLDKTQRLVNAERAAYISHKSKYMFASKQSEIEKKLVQSGFEIEAKPPLKIEVNWQE